VLSAAGSGTSLLDGLSAGSVGFFTIRVPVSFLACCPTACAAWCERTHWRRWSARVGFDLRALSVDSDDGRSWPVAFALLRAVVVALCSVTGRCGSLVCALCCAAFAGRLSVFRGCGFSMVGIVRLPPAGICFWASTWPVAGLSFRVGFLPNSPFARLVPILPVASLDLVENFLLPGCDAEGCLCLSGAGDSAEGDCNSRHSFRSLVGSKSNSC